MKLVAIFFAALCAALLLGPLSAVAQPANSGLVCAVGDVRTDVRPDPRDVPTVVHVGMRVMDIIDISDVDQTISIDVAMRLQWTDPRLAEYAGCNLPTSQIWFPTLILRNSGRIFDRWPLFVRVADGGKVTYLQRSSGTFSSYQDLRGYPFDDQTITIELTPLDWGIEKVVFAVDEEFVGVAETLNISDWRIHGIDVYVDEIDVPAFSQTRSAINLDVMASRYVSYYLWKILLPIALIVVMSWSVFYVHPTQFGTQLGLSATSVLTMVAFIFATTNLLPRLGYFTLLDSFIAMSTIFVFVSLLQSLTTGFLATRGRERIAVLIDLVSRILFPLAFAAGCLYYFANIIEP